MINYPILLLAGLLVLAPGAAKAQQLLSLEEAMTEALSNNYDIRLQRYETERNSNNVSRAISGQRPTAEFTAAYEYGYADAEIVTGAGTDGGQSPPLELSGTSQDITLKNQLSIPIFQGFRGKYRYEQLETIYQSSELQLQQVMEQVIAQTVSAYLQVSRLQSLLRINEETIAISQDRYARASTSASFGAANSIRVLQAEVDLKTDSADYRSTLLQYQNARRDLSLIMASETEIDYQVAESVSLIGDLNYESLLSAMQANNLRLQLSQKGVDNALLETKISNASKLPTLQGYVNMTYLNTEDEASFLSSNRVLGPNAGIQLSFPWMTGGANKIKRQNARISYDQQQTALTYTELQLQKELRNAFASYVNNKAQLRIEQSNLLTFERNFEKVSADYRLGQVAASDLRTAQLNLARAKNRINNLAFGVKQSEISLLQLSGQLQLQP